VALDFNLSSGNTLPSLKILKASWDDRLSHIQPIASLSSLCLSVSFVTIQPFDRNMVPGNDPHDAYLELGGQDDSEEEYTWGQQVPQWIKEKFGCSRTDRILLWGEIGARSFERFGAGVKVRDERVRNEMVNAVQLEWVSDHLGVMAELEIRSSRSDLS
jgi:tyrosyl-DNA phosphodiesterase 2